MRYDARILDPAKALQPGATRRDRDNRNGVDPGRPVSYGTTAYVGNELLVSAADQSDATLVGVERQLNEILAAPAGSARRGPTAGRRSVRPGPGADLARTSSPRVIRLAVESTAADPGPPPDAWKAVQRAARGRRAPSRSG